MKKIMAIVAIAIYIVSANSIPALPDIEELKRAYLFSEWPGKDNRQLLPRVDLTKENIPEFQDASKSDNFDNAFVSSKFEERYVITYDFRWSVVSEWDARIRMTVGGACEDAHEYLLNRFSTRTLPNLSVRDVPVIAGDISFDEGAFFIRNNLAVEILVRDKMQNKASEIARQIDEVLLKQPVQNIDSPFRPVITKMDFLKVDGLIRTAKIIPGYYDPLGGKVYIDVNYRNGTENFYMEDGVWYYSLYQPGSSVLTILFVNDRGFSTVMKFNITATETDIFSTLRGE